MLDNGGHGKVNYAVKATEWLVKNPKIKTLLCVGAGGALSPELNIGDVVVATRHFEHDYKERFLQDSPLPSGDLNPSYISLFEELKKQFPFLHLGPIASGDEDIVSEKRAQEICDQTSAMVVAWEGMGGVKSCKHLGRNFIEIRGITDHCGGSAPQDFHKNLTLAMTQASQVVKALIASDL